MAGAKIRKKVAPEPEPKLNNFCAATHGSKGREAKREVEYRCPNVFPTVPEPALN